MSDKDESVMPELFLDHPSGKRFPIFFDAVEGEFWCKIGRKKIRSFLLQEIKDQINAVTTPEIKHDLWITEVQPAKWNRNMRFIDHRIVGQIGPKTYVTQKGKTFQAIDEVSLRMDHEARITLRYLHRKIKAAQNAYKAYLDGLQRPMELLIADTVVPDTLDDEDDMIEES